ncbi:HAD family hydrolase [Salibacterium halotolerans]|uniref:Cof subfamily of IIB subfamily of haloacid dehalogenase superfamily/HAD-superfamily hydrolase, subfamily IIB n=1 Tax=Salibacterium halotolerans TaxID=1884432 RepID=A0A1I5XE79_9BACI|nr:HAD family hydrolase [Salibacterium halotolerans]SFQ30204.1 hypothetical protein SAMN05518683_12714 [Salibacterium halotolerans]
MKLTAIDMDGTLLHSSGYVTAGNADALQRLQQEGHKVVISTGRDISDVKRLLGEVNVVPDGIVSLNGGLVTWHDQHVHTSYMNPDDVIELAEWLDEHQFYYHINTDDGIYSPPRSRDFFLHDLDVYAEDKEKGEEIKEAIRRRADEHHGLYNIKELPSPSMVKERGLTVYKFLILSMLEPKLQRCADHWNGSPGISITSSSRDNLEMLHPDTEKGKGLNHLLSYAGLEDIETFAIGDNFNDLSMFATASTAIAMGNAEDGVKQKADVTTAPHDDDGVALAVDSHILDSSASPQ